MDLSNVNEFHRLFWGTPTDTDDALDTDNYLDDEDICDESDCSLSPTIRLTIPQHVICGSNQHRWMEGISNSHIPTSPRAVEV